MTYIITGASGQLGRRTAELALERTDPADLVLISRSPGKLADLAGRGATVRFGDFDQPESLVEAFAGGDRLLLVSSDQMGRRITQHTNAIDAARAAGVGHITYTSITNPVADHPFTVVPEHQATEEALADSGLGTAVLRNALYADLRITEARQAIDAGQLVTNQGQGRTAPVTRDDCAAVAATVLLGGPEHDKAVYDITGAELLGAADLAAIYGRLGGREIPVVQVDDAALVSGLEAAGLPPEVAGMVASIGTAIRTGYMDQVSSAVADLTGRAPTTVEALLTASQD